MQKRNNYTEIEDFLADESFQKWILLKIDEEGWEEWTLENRQRAKLVEDARLLLLAMKVSKPQLSKAELSDALSSTWKKIADRETNFQKGVISFKRGISRNWMFGAAAAVLVCFFSIWFYEKDTLPTDNVVSYKELIEENNEGLVEQTNNTEKSQIITLSDGSSVLLQPNSKLSYPKIFTGNERKVYLSGEGFFEISKNPKKPFFVYANEIVTRVVGTSFRIKAYPDQQDVEVLVRTGKVRVKPNDLLKEIKNEEVVLLPNQALRFTRKEMVFNKILNITEDQILTSSTRNIEQLSFEFTDIPVEQILKTIEQAYQVEIDYPKDKLQDCRLTTSLSDQPLPEKLKIICKSLGNETNYEMNGNQIVITSLGCN